MAPASASAADVTSIAILGKDNEPLYIREFIRIDNTDVDGQQHQQDESELLFDLPSTGSGTGIDSDTGSTDKCSVRQQFIMYAALDRLDQLAGPPPGYGWRNNNNSINKGGADGMFVGLLCPAEDQRVYGYVSTTKIKFLLVTEDDGTSTSVSSSSENDGNSENIKLLLTQIHELYIEDMLNPFKIIGSPITSKRFERRIEELIQAFNQISDGII
mmetsp:Transcript_46886/g.114359  ORF Transcript_46886/g.114359 Transcript_46886/m.114359 type:complete len:215 (-) Transcript_46886:2159-2803(-)